MRYQSKVISGLVYTSNKGYLTLDVGPKRLFPIMGGTKVRVRSTMAAIEAFIGVYEDIILAALTGQPYSGAVAYKLKERLEDAYLDGAK